MNKSLQKIIDKYKNGLLETHNLQIKNQEFSTEVIFDEENLAGSCFTNLRLTNLEFTNVNFESSYFVQCLFKNCIFENTFFTKAQFLNCNLINCQIKDCDFKDADFRETTFDKCNFEKVHTGSLTKSWFELCDFIDTNFINCDAGSLLQTAVVDSKFSRFDKSIEFKGDFYMYDILLSENGINDMFIE